jgi:Family of unknown function (DUF5906)
VQRPQEKINHGIVMGGPPGVGKDTIIEPVKHAVGPWNVREVSPTAMLEPFNEYVKAVILRVSEARDLGESNRFALYEHMKNLLATPPDVIRCNEKHLRAHSVFNVMGGIITANRKDSFYLPPDDRRHYVAWTDITKDDFEDGYWDKIWGWYKAGGYGHVAAYLAQLDLSDFNPKAPPLKTPAFWEIVETNRSPENSELADALDKLGKRDGDQVERPAAVTLDMIRRPILADPFAGPDFGKWLDDRKNSRQIPHRMSECGYIPVRNPAAKDGQWRICGKRQTVYAKAELSPHDRHVAVTTLMADQEKKLKEWEAKRDAAKEAWAVKTEGPLWNGRFRHLARCGRDTVCVACGKPGDVHQLKDTTQVGSKSETLHQGCAAKWFDGDAGHVEGTLCTEQDLKDFK